MKVLIVEDSQDFAKSLKNFFSLDGHTNDHACTLSEAREFIDVSHYDIVLLDIMLPDGDGRRFLDEMRSRNDDSPVIVMTARSEVTDRIDLLDIGADDYIVKPFEFAELEARCRAVLRRHKGQNQLQLTFGQVVLQPLLATLEHSGTTHALRNRELRLLEVFFNSPGIYLTKEQLSDRLFSISESVTENAIEVYVGRLRKKLAGSDARIETVRGIGYRLIST